MKTRYIKIFLFIYFLLSIGSYTQVCGAYQKIDINGDFERDQNWDGIPDKWHAWVRQGHEGEVTFIYDREVKKIGDRSVRITNRGDETSCYYQNLKLSSSDNSVYELKGYMKTYNVEGVRAGAWIVTVDEKGKKDFNYVSLRTGGNHDWRFFRKIFAIPKDVVSIDVQLLMEGKGTMWFDGFELTRREIAEDKIIYRGEQRFLKVDEDSYHLFLEKHPGEWLLLLPENPDTLWQMETIYAEKHVKKQLFAAGKEKKRFAWGVYNPETKAEIAFLATDLVHTEIDEIIPCENITIQKVHYWDQRIGWRSTVYYTIPELIQPVTVDTLDKKNFGHYWTTILIPPQKPAGLYHGKIKVLLGEQVNQEIEIELRIFPFDLISPEESWALYPGNYRWRNYTVDEIKKEMNLIKEQGINVLFIEPIIRGDFKIQNDQLVINLNEANRYMELYEKMGFREPLLFSLQHADEHIRRLYRKAGIALSNETFEKAYKNLLQAIKTMKQEGNWPEFVVIIIDEFAYKLEKKQKEALHLYELAKEIGLSTCVTSDEKIVRQKLGDLIDIRSFSLKYVLLTEGQNERIRNELCKRSEPFWWYGSGCYPGQEGKIFPNRFLTGFLFWKSGADVQWSWTFQRPKGNPYDDFDGSGKEPKDACIVYPLKKGNGFIPTLQWEGIREGITDMKYISTLKHYIELGKQSLSPDMIVKAGESEKRLQAIKEQIPWFYDGGFDNTRADKFRWEIAQQIIRLQQKLD